MTQQQVPHFEVPAEMREFAEKSVEQARKAFDTFMGAAYKAVNTADGSAETVRTNTQDMTRKALSLAEENVRAAFEHAQKLVRAKDMQEAMQLQTEFWKSQLAFIQKNMAEMGADVQKAATSTTKRKS